MTEPLEVEIIIEKPIDRRRYADELYPLIYGAETDEEKSMNPCDGCPYLSASGNFCLKGSRENCERAQEDE